MNLHIIPNSLIAWLGIAFYAYAFVSGMPVDQIVWHSQVCVMALVAGLGALNFGIPGGMAKLIAVAFLWLGFQDGLTFLIISILLTGGAAWVRKLSSSADSVPYLPFAALTAVLMIGSAIYDSGHTYSVDPESHELVVE